MATIDSTPLMMRWNCQVVGVGSQGFWGGVARFQTVRL